MTQDKTTPSIGRIAWGRHLLLFGVAAWMFVLGILVGRGTAPVEFDTQALQKELAALRDSMVNKRLGEIESAMRGEDEKASLEFYEALKKDGPDTTVQTRDASATGSHQNTRLPHKPRAVLMAKKTDIAVKSAPRTASDQQRVAPTPPPAQAGKLTIQVAALQDAEAAERIIANLKKDGYPAYLSRHGDAGKGQWFRVRVGRYADDKQAESDMARLKRNRKNPIIVEAENE